MKTVKYTLFFFAFILLMTSCSEVPVEINRGGGPIDPADQELETQLQNVLIEEYTGVRCVNCPAGAEKIQQLLGIHGERLVVVAIHGGGFDIPYPSSNEDFRLDDAQKLLRDFQVLGLPGGTINRKKYEGHFGLDLGIGDWAGIIEDQKKLTPSVGMLLETTFDVSSRSLKVVTKILTKQDISASDVRLTLMITESKIIDTQLTPAGINENYEFNHALRNFITPYNGEPIADDLVLNEITEKTHTYTIPESWNVANLEVVGLVHLNTDVKDVLQSVGQKLTE